MKLLLTILLFSGIANAQNTVLRDTNGIAWVLQANTVRHDPAVTMGEYQIVGGLSLFIAATGCTKGRGTLYMRPLAPEHKAAPFKEYDWGYRGGSFRDDVAIALCAEGLK
jgi:hypothetical protein